MASGENLGQKFETYVDDLVKTGRYASRSEVLQDGVRLIEEREKQLSALDDDLAQGLADVESGRVMPIDEAFRRLRLELGLPETSSD